MKCYVALLLSWVLFVSPAYAAYQGTPPELVANGGTGAQTFTAHGVLFGEGTSALGVSATGASGIPLIGQGGSSDPIFGTAVVAGGGTGLATLTAHNVMLGEGTSNVAFAAPGATVGVPLISQNATTDPVFGTAVVAGGGTGQITLAANGVLVGEGTSGVHVVGTSSSADAVVLWGAAGSDPTAASVGSCSAGTSALTYNTSTHAFGCNTISTGIVPTEATATGASPITITATNLLTTVVSMATPAASTINLPTAVQTAGWRECVKDGTTNFATNNATVKSPTSGKIDNVAGATGIVMNQQHGELCFMSDGTDWWIE